MSEGPLFRPLVLPGGQKLSHRVVKASMEENLAGPGQLPDHRLRTLYRAWGSGGAGLLLTGNVMIDRRAVTGPAGVVLERGTPLRPFERWAEAARASGAQVWMQINHPGRQVRADLGGISWAPSAVPIGSGGVFARPTAMDEDDLAEVVGRFADTAGRAVEAGFTGVQIHAAHGYLLSQFLSPLVNRRTDGWSGSVAGRARLLLAVVDAVAARLPSGAALSVKLNTADFQRGGFGPDDALEVVDLLASRPVDVLELSGGSAERPVMHGAALAASTLAREAYFLEHAHRIVAAARMPTMLTGGIRTRAVAERVRADGVDLVGVASGFAMRPDFPERWRRGADVPLDVPLDEGLGREKASEGKQSVVRWMLRRWAGHPTDVPPPPATTAAIAADRARRRRYLPRYRAFAGAGSVRPVR